MANIICTSWNKEKVSEKSTDQATSHQLALPFTFEGFLIGSIHLRIPLPLAFAKRKIVYMTTEEIPSRKILIVKAVSYPMKK